MFVRCPIDREYPYDPRIFVTGKVLSINEFNETAYIKFSDPFDQKKYFEYIPDETLFPLDMAENLGMFDEIDPLSQISETDPRHWQMEWMDNYMDALEELEDSTTRE